MGYIIENHNKQVESIEDFKTGFINALNLVLENSKVDEKKIDAEEYEHLKSILKELSEDIFLELEEYQEQTEKITKFFLNSCSNE